MKHFSKILALTTLAASVSFATYTDSDVATKLEANASAGIVYEAGRTTLTAEETMALDEIVAQAREGNKKIDEVRVIVWADKDFPVSMGRSATREDMKLADARAQNIKDYLRKELKVRDVATFNMARQPNSLQNLYRAQGLAMSPNSEAAMSAAQPKASEALVLVYNK